MELLDSDMIPALIEFYLSPKSLQKKTFLKLLINHWICEISEMQSLINKIIDPFAFAQVFLKLFFFNFCVFKFVLFIFPSDNNRNVYGYY